jgi:hypothetical protein
VAVSLDAEDQGALAMQAILRRTHSREAQGRAVPEEGEASMPPSRVPAEAVAQSGYTRQGAADMKVEQARLELAATGSKLTVNATGHDYDPEAQAALRQKAQQEVPLTTAH